MSRRGRLISLPMNDAASAPAKAESMVAQMPQFATVRVGLKDCVAKLVAGPNLDHTRNAKREEQGYGYPCADRAKVIKPLPDVQSDQVQDERERKPDN